MNMPKYIIWLNYDNYNEKDDGEDYTADDVELAVQSFVRDRYGSHQHLDPGSVFVRHPDGGLSKYSMSHKVKFQVKKESYVPPLKASEFKMTVDKDGEWSEYYDIELMRAEGWRRDSNRYNPGEVIAVIGWSSGDVKTRQGNKLQAMNAKELDEFGDLCKKAAEEMRKHGAPSR